MEEALFRRSGQPELQPLVEASVQSLDFLISAVEEHARQTGARGLVGSSAVENDFHISWDKVTLRFKLRWRDAARTRNHQAGTCKGLFVA